MSDKPFSIDIGGLKTRRKDTSPQRTERVEQAAEDLGFVNRNPTGRRGRPASPRTGQVHAKVMPHVADEIREESLRRGVQQGVLIEEAWELYKAR
ncbi:MAG: hypothetical protein ACRC44_09205 [Bifidobacterium asteroides]